MAGYLAVLLTRWAKATAVRLSYPACPRLIDLETGFVVADVVGTWR